MVDWASLDLTGFETVLISFFIIVLSIIIGNVFYSLFRNFFDKRFSKRASKLVSRLIEYSIVLVLLFIGLIKILSVDLTAFTASLGVVGVIVAFSSTQIIQNALAGILIMLQRPIQLEDWIEIGAATETSVSKVRDISLMRTTLRNKDGKVIFIPNNILLSSRITNYTKSGFVELSIPFVIPKDVNYDVVKQTILEVANKNGKVLPNVPRKEKILVSKLLSLKPIKELFGSELNMEFFHPRILILDISNSKISVSLRVWIREIFLKEEIISEITGDVDELLKKKEIKI